MPGSASLDVSTREAGTESGKTVIFDVKAELVDDSHPMSDAVLTSHIVANYQDATLTTLEINNLVPGAEYRFSVRIRNEYGTSEFSEARQLRILTLMSSSSSTAGIYPIMLLL